MSGNISLPQMKVLYGCSGSVCAICKVQLAIEKQDGSYYQIGEMGHIEGEKPASKRYNPDMTDKERQSYNNLILLCPNCHTLIDNDEEKYTVDYLLNIKSTHESKIRQVYIKPINGLQYVELAAILKYLSSDSVGNNKNYSDYNSIRPDEKISKNNLSNSTADYITMGLNRFNLLQDYLNENLDIEFAENLRKTFVEKYRKLKETTSDNDKIFYELWEFASLNNSDKKYQAAGLTIVTYFFHECEVLEK